MKLNKIHKRNLSLKQNGRNLIAILFFALITLAGCQGESLLDAAFPQQKKTQEFSHQVENTPQPTEALTETVSPKPPSNEISLWVPEKFDPDLDSEAAAILKNRLLAFSEANTEIILDVRVKANSGPSGILETLIGASEAAPEALPALVLISRSDMVQAAENNLIFPIEGLSEVADENDWFDISRELGFFQGIGYCLPFAADALSLVKSGDNFANYQPSWDEIIRQSEKLWFAAGDAESLVSLALYQSAAGAIFKESGQAVIDVEALEAVLDIYASAGRLGRIPASMLDYQTDDQVWENFLSSKDGVILTLASRALSKLNTYQFALMPGVDNNPYTLASGWVLCQTEPHEQDRIYSMVLAEYLVDAKFLTSWAPVSGYLPVRPSSVLGFKEAELQDKITQMLFSAHLRPEKAKITAIGSEIKSAISDVLQRINSPETSAQNAAKRLEVITIQ